MKPIKIIVTGASGRMGQTIIKKILINKSLKLIGVTEGSKNKFLGSDISELVKSKKTGIIVTDKIEPLFAKADAVIDFTIPIATLKHAKMAAKYKIVHVIGTTGFSPSDEKKLIWPQKKQLLLNLEI